MSLEVFYLSARELEIPEGFLLTPEGLSLRRKIFLEVRPLPPVSERGMGRIRAAARGACEELLLLDEKRGLWCGRLGGPFHRLKAAEEAFRGAQVLALAPDILYAAGPQRVLGLGLPLLRKVLEFEGPGEDLLSAAVRRDKLFLFTASREVLVYQRLTGRLLTRVNFSGKDYKALGAAGFLYWFTGKSLVFGAREIPLSRDLSEAFFLPGRPDPWFLSPEGGLFRGAQREAPPSEWQTGPYFTLPEEFSGGLLFLAGRGEIQVEFQGERRSGPVMPLPDFEDSLRGRLYLRGEALFSWLLAVPRAGKWLQLLPEAYREGGEPFLLPLFSAFRLLHHLLLYRKEDLLQALGGEGDSEDLRFALRLLGFSPEGFAEKDLPAWLSKLPELYRRRGSVGALREVLDLVAGGRASLREAIEWREVESSRGPFSRLFGTRGSLFLVFVRPELPRERLALLRKLLPEWTPLGAEGRVMPLEPGFTLGTPLALGVNTVLPRGELRLGVSRLGQDSALSRRSPVSRLNLLATLGQDTQI